MKSILDVVVYLCCFSFPQSNIFSNNVDQSEVFEFSFCKPGFERNLINLIIVSRRTIHNSLEVAVLSEYVTTSLTRLFTVWYS